MRGANGTRMLVRLRYVDTADFRKSEATNYQLLPKEVRDSVKEGEAVCFKSPTGNQVVFVVKPRTLATVAPIHRRDGTVEEAEIYCSVRLRLPPHRTWNPLMLADYAEQAGLELIGIKRLNEHLTKAREEADVEDES